MPDFTYGPPVMHEVLVFHQAEREQESSGFTKGALVVFGSQLSYV